MADFTKAFELMIGHEGGYVNDPQDPGGETKFGISKRSYPKEDIKNLTIERAREIYMRDFWNPILGDQINDQNIANSIFDFAVNAGTHVSEELAQIVVKTPVDGTIGKQTLQAINSIDPEKFLASFKVEKITRYISICKKRPESKKYFFGWVCRALNL